MLTFVFVAIAFLGAVCTRDKARGMGVALMLWFFFALLFDGIALFILFTVQDYPLEKATIALVALNPIDLARTFVLLQMNVSALMGMTGAVMREFLGTGLSVDYTLGLLLLWIIIPLLLGQKCSGERTYDEQVEDNRSTAQASIGGARETQLLHDPYMKSQGSSRHPFMRQAVPEPWVQGR